MGDHSFSKQAKFSKKLTFLKEQKYFAKFCVRTKYPNQFPIQYPNIKNFQ